MSNELDLASFIRDVPDFPKAGIVFKDITPLLGSSAAFEETVERMAAAFAGREITKVAGIESRGFIFGAALAVQLAAGFVPIRKPKKLPWRTFRHEYELEYGTDVLEIHDDALTSGDHVLIVDDVLATGGTGAAARVLVERFGSRVAGLSIVIELEFLKGRDRLKGFPVHSLIQYR
ncbi:MAG TPA: adenine phosphoribosyltransferase [Thermoanaerobaculia bacterium]|nr:adenine phosphoribosyltransferase [Thermoanaerobaculia bacterium]